MFRVALDRSRPRHHILPLVNYNKVRRAVAIVVAAGSKRRVPVGRRAPLDRALRAGGELGPSRRGVVLTQQAACLRRERWHLLRPISQRISKVLSSSDPNREWSPHFWTLRSDK